MSCDEDAVLKTVEKIVAENADLKHNIERQVAAASELATENAALAWEVGSSLFDSEEGAKAYAASFSASVGAV